MFDGIKLLCISKNRQDFKSCLTPLIVPSDKFLKIANDLNYCCRGCGRKSKALRSFFMEALRLQKAVNSISDTDFYLSNYNLGFVSCHEDEFPVTPHILENSDWGHWNMQISSITIAKIDEPGSNVDIREDCFEKARPFVHPIVKDLTFNNVLHRKSLIGPYHEIKDLRTLKELIRQVRKYNIAWWSLLDSLVCAAPVDLEDGRYTYLNNVSSLAMLYPTETYV